MFETMRKVFGPITVGVIIGAIALVFVFYGVYNPKSNFGSNAAAATVNGDRISFQEFDKEYQQRVEFYQSLMKGKVDVNLLRQLGIQKQVLEDLITRKLLLQEAQRLKILVSDEELRSKIEEMPYFKDKKSGQFDPKLYNDLLKANRRSPGEFEQIVREDVLRARLVSLVQGLVKVSEDEIKQEFENTEDKRQVKYVLIDQAFGKKKLKITENEINDFLKDEGNLKLAQSYYEQHKYEYLKPSEKPAVKNNEKDKKPEAKPKEEYIAFNDVKQKIARIILGEKQIEQVMKTNRKMAEEVLEKAKSLHSESQFQSFLKANELVQKESEKFNRTQTSIASTVLDAKQVIEDSFVSPSPLGKEPKMYELGTGGFLIVSHLKVEAPKKDDFDKNKKKLKQEILSRKEQYVFEQLRKELREKSKVTMNQVFEKGAQAVE